MSNYRQYFGAMDDLIQEVGTLSHIEIYTNPIPDSSEDDYASTTKQIHKEWKVPTTHYIYDAYAGGTFSITLNPGGISCWPKVIGTFLSLP